MTEPTQPPEGDRPETVPTTPKSPKPTAAPEATKTRKGARDSKGAEAVKGTQAATGTETAKSAEAVKGAKAAKGAKAVKSAQTSSAKGRQGAQPPQATMEPGAAHGLPQAAPEAEASEGSRPDRRTLRHNPLDDLLAPPAAAPLPAAAGPAAGAPASVAPVATAPAVPAAPVASAPGERKAPEPGPAASATRAGAPEAKADAAARPPKPPEPKRNHPARPAVARPAVARPAAAPAPRLRPLPAGGQFLTFRLAGERFAADILQVREILERGAITRVPRTPVWVHGVMNLRGSVVPVLDLAAKLGLPPCQPTRHTCIVVTESDPDDDATVVGLLVDRVEEVLEVPAERLQAPPDFGTSVHPAFLQGLAETGDSLALVLDLAQVMGDPELADGWLPPGAEGSGETKDAAPSENAPPSGKVTPASSPGSEGEASEAEAAEGGEG